MLKERNTRRAALSALPLAIMMLLTTLAVGGLTTSAGASGVQAGQPTLADLEAATPGLNPRQRAKRKAINSQAKLSQSGKGQSALVQAARLRSKQKNAYFDSCRQSRRFRENQASFPRHVRIAGRCVTTQISGIKTIGTRPGHHPSASRALDIMVNTKGSCRAGRKAGNQIARYLMAHKKIHNVYYIIWRNGYWNARENVKPIGKFRKMGRGGCTAGHYDHVHVAFR